MVVPPVADVAAPLAETSAPPRCLIIGCGNPTRADDGVGPWVVRELLARQGERLPPRVRIVDAGTSGMEVLFTARGAERLILVDACSGAGAPGSVFRVPGAELESGEDPGYTLHGFRWNQALHAGKKMYGNDFPARVEVFLVEAADLDFGLELSADARAGAEQVLHALEQEIATYQP